MSRRESRAGRRALDVACTVDLEASPARLHAHVELDGVEIRPGDSVLVHDAPSEIAFGERLRCQRRATVVRAGRLRRAWTRLFSVFELFELFEVGFSSRRTR